MTQGAIWNIFGMLRLTPWILGRFIYVMDPCLFVILWKNGWTDFHEFFKKRQARHKKWLFRLFHYLHRLLHGLPSRRPGRVCEQNHGKVDEWIFMKFSWYVGYDTRNNLEHFGDDRFNHSDTWFFFLFSGSVFVGNIIPNTGWMDIH